MVLWVIFQVVVIYLIVIVIIAAQVAIYKDLPLTEKNIDPLDINSGDILGVGYRNPFGWIVTAWSSSVWSHTGIAWRDPKTSELFVMEAAFYGDNYKGVFRIPFDLWSKINKNSYLCHVRLKSEQPISVEEMDRIFSKLEFITLDTFNWEWYRFLYKRKYVEEPLKEHYTCYEISILLLQEMGIYAKEYTASSYSSKDLVWSHIPMMKGYTYEEPILLRYTHVE